MKRNIPIPIVLLVYIFITTSCGGGKFTYNRDDDMPDFPVNHQKDKVEYAETINVDSMATKSQLYTRAREWFAETYNSSKNVVQMEDKESGKIIGKASFPVTMKTIFNTDSPGGRIKYTISVFVKDGKYKYKITDFNHRGEYTGSGTIPDGGSIINMMELKKGYWGNSYEKTYLYNLIQLDEKISNLIDDLKKSMNEESEDW